GCRRDEVPVSPMGSSPRRDDRDARVLVSGAKCVETMIDRLVCADGGNPDQTTTHGKKVEEAKALELKGWHYTLHLAGRVFSVFVHGDTVGAETLRRSLTDWLTDMKLIPAMSEGGIDRYIGYYDPYATSHDALDEDTAVQHEVRSAAKALVEAVALSRAGKLPRVQADSDPRPKGANAPSRHPDASRCGLARG